jgi:hypothetical protein
MTSATGASRSVVVYAVRVGNRENYRGILIVSKNRLESVSGTLFAQATGQMI